MSDDPNIPNFEVVEKPGQNEIGDGANIPKFEAKEEEKQKALEEISAEIKDFEEKLEETKKIKDSEYLMNLKDSIEEIKFLIMRRRNLKDIDTDAVKRKIKEIEQRFAEQSGKENDKN